MTCHICKEPEHIYKDCPNRYKVFRDAMNRWLTVGLFLETHNSGQDKYIVYTLEPYSRNGLPSLHQLYLQYEDLTEYQFSRECLGGWDHWQEILQSDKEKLHQYINTWRSELEIKLKSQAFKRIINEAEADGRNGFAANKYVIERSWAGDFSKPKPRQNESKRGRPSKQEVSQKAFDIASETKAVKEDFDRLFPSVQKGPDTTSSTE